jgi:hypothetical protein
MKAGFGNFKWTHHKVPIPLVSEISFPSVFICVHPWLTSFQLHEYGQEGRPALRSALDEGGEGELGEWLSGFKKSAMHATFQHWQPPACL